MTRLDDRRLLRAFGRLDGRSLDEELPDRDGVGGVVRALVDDLQRVIRCQHGCGHLHAAGSPSIGHRHLAAREGNLIAGNGNRLQDGATDHPLGLLVQIGEVVGWRVHSAASSRSLLASARIAALSSTSSDWKST